MWQIKPPVLGYLGPRGAVSMVENKRPERENPVWVGIFGYSGRGLIKIAPSEPETGPAARVGRRYLFLNAGLRFSTKAAMPSFWSSVANIE